MITKEKIWKLQSRLGITSFSNNTKQKSIIAKLNGYDVISFDIFDTLLYRTVSAPSDVFDIVGSEMGIIDFKVKRIEAEEIARGKIINREPNISEIYTFLDFSNCEDIKAKEQLVEKRVCVKNEYMLGVFENLLPAKEIIITSDMYLPSTLLKDILEDAGYKGFQKLFVSNEYRKSKFSGDLYRYISGEFLNGKRVIHIGDNEHSDYVMALRNSWKALHYRGDKG